MPEDRSGLTLLTDILKACSPLAIAFSGGLDSRFLAFMARRLAPEGVKAHLYFFNGPHLGPSELGQAQDWARDKGMPFTRLELNPLQSPEIRGNEPERCYRCKLLLFRAMKRTVSEHPPFPGETATLCDGSNMSDRKGYRPGQRALKELSVRSPLAEAGLGKGDIHAFGATLGLDNPDQHARPCLLTRYAYGLTATEDSLLALGKAEQSIFNILREAMVSGALPALPDFRLRLVDGPVDDPGDDHVPARKDYTTELHINGALPQENLRQALVRAVTEQGFAVPPILRADRISGFYDRNAGDRGK